MLEAKDLITVDNVVKTYPEGKYICFVLKNGFTVKLDPNKIPAKGSEEKKPC
jgi:hypothetical protein